jgi:antitoxin VapB
MAFHIRNDEAEQMLRELQSLTGESLTDVVKTALSERLERERAKVPHDGEEDMMTMMEAMWARLRLVPRLDYRTADEIIGYDENGLPT